MQVSQAIQFLKGNTKLIQDKLEKEMIDASEKQHFELAKIKRDQIQAIKILQEKQKVDLIKNFDQNFIAYVENKDRCAISLFKISKGVISG